MPVPKELGKGYRERKVKPQSYFDQRSFRWKRIPAKGTLKSYILIGCKKGNWNAKKGVCKIGTEAYTIAVPKKKKRNPYPLLIASINPRDSGLLKKYGGIFGVNTMRKAIDGFRRIHGPDAVIKPIVRNIKGLSGILIKRGNLERLDYDASSVKGSKLSGATYFHKSGDRQHAKGKIKSEVYHTPNLKRTIILHANKYVNPEGMLDG